MLVASLSSKKIFGLAPYTWSLESGLVPIPRSPSIVVLPALLIEIPDEEAGNIVTVGDSIEVIKKCKAIKGKKKKISAATLKSKQTVVPHPDSPFMSKPAGQSINKDFSSKETQEAMERLHDDIRESKDNTELS